MGRSPLDEDAIRLIEEHHPHIRFDWPQILKGEEESIPSAPPYRPPRDVHTPAVVRAQETVEAAESALPMADEPISPAHARLGSEGLARLRGRYAQVQAALSRRVADETRRDQLKSEAERLNPDGWVTDDEVTAGLEQYEAVLAALRDVIGRRRRRRGGQGRPQGPPDGQSTMEQGPVDVGDDGEDEPSGEEPGSAN